ncbi:pyridoxamine 5'-phosphate oxidase family protein [Marinicella litoralis]|uniref:Pyridoxamine 5'-phosphate oxidase n=1 Tax=Marinicella litoralis TaxID=644220 RepID=A0A4R6XLJ5_9GAMM|nr:pyridoxamine 5'-phosphate oxidase family protein [Marinicella litoralis]TDR20495.1 pyridoxamine 5'-phosphate oxidase [Marinicella litoralis]
MQINDQLFKTKIKPLFSQAVFVAVATVNQAGMPHVTPIGSVVLKDKNRGWFFQKFTKNIPQNAEHCEYATLMAVNDGKWFWLKSLIKGQFKQPPAMRLLVKLGDLRPATEAEAQKFKRRVSLFKHSKGHALMWQDMANIREFEIIEYKPIYIGQMTAKQLT